MSDQDQPEATEALSAAREARITLKAAVSAVEVAAAAPAGDPDWGDELGRELRRLRAAFDDHVTEVEGEDGLLTELMAEAPQLANQINAVKEEHPVLCQRIDDTIEMVASGAEPIAVRDAVLDTLLGIARHRQHGSDLVYQAYSIDIGNST